MVTGRSISKVILNTMKSSRKATNLVADEFSGGLLIIS